MNELEGRWSILVVDEHRENEEAFRAHLEQEGYAVVSVDSEEAAYDAFLREPFDTVLARLSWSTEGQTLLERLNKLAPEVPIIVVEEAEGSDADAAMQRGAFGIVHHPPSLKEVRRVLMHARVYRGLEQQRRRALEEARAYKKFYEDVLRSVSDGLLVFDARGKLRFQNARVDEILGQETFEDEEFDPEATNLHKNLISQILQLVASTLTEGVEERRMLVFKGEARSMYLEVMTSKLRGSDGSIQGAIAALRDRSEERLLEEQLMHTERLATLGGLLAAIAHDIHNPLGAITGCAEIGLEAAQETEEAAAAAEGPAKAALEQAARDMKELFDQVHDAGLRCRTIADNLLAYSRRSPARRQRVNLNEVLKDTVQFVSRYRKLGRVEVVYKLEPGLADAAVDGAEVQQAFTNIIDNAIQAMDDCETQRLELASRSEGGQVIIEIADSGPGIPEKRLKRIWQPFFTTKGSGTGLGLHITKRVIENQNGRISVVSEVGRGTAFTIELPLV